MSLLLQSFAGDNSAGNHRIIAVERKQTLLVSCQWIAAIPKLVEKPFYCFHVILAA